MQFMCVLMPSTATKRMVLTVIAVFVFLQRTFSPFIFKLNYWGSQVLHSNNPDTVERETYGVDYSILKNKEVVLTAVSVTTSAL